MHPENPTITNQYIKISLLSNCTNKYNLNPFSQIIYYSGLFHNDSENLL